MNPTLFVSRPLLEAYFGLFIPIQSPGVKDLIILGVIILNAMLMGLIPALRVYRQSLSDGMTIR